MNKHDKQLFLLEIKLKYSNVQKLFNTKRFLTQKTIFCQPCDRFCPKIHNDFNQILKYRNSKFKGKTN